MITIKPYSFAPNIKHGFFTRAGGVSHGLYSSLNCGFGSGDSFENVNTNRNRTLIKLGVPNRKLLTCNQVHSAIAIAVTRPWGRGDVPKADGMATNIPGVVLGILTADCAPVLFADSTAGIIGAAHAGWQGALNGILEATAGEMVGLGSSYGNISVAIGPCIGQRSYEIGPEFRDNFIMSSIKNNRFFEPSQKKGHYMFDLVSYVKHRLLKMGVSKIYRTEYDTYRDKDLFFSYRRSVKRGEPVYGRELSAITLNF
jgi:YfiH family protein